MARRSTTRRGRPAAVVAGLVASILAWSGTVAAPETSDGSFDLPTLLATPVSATATTSAPAPVLPETTTTTAAPVRQPLVFDPIPPGRPNVGGDRHADVPAPAFGMIEIAKIGLVHPVFEGLDEPVIHWGPGHWPGSAMPGAPGNAVFAGHRVTHTRPFLDIDLLTPGDPIVVRTNDGTFTYEVTEHLVVTPDATWIAQPTADATLTLFACHPKRSARQRYIVRARLVSSALAE
ncbi:MAG TPA: class E sortase [Acidimicrobiia bacterium]|nr:class E sortase [Acidimicrobiia bacterium]